MKKWIWQVLKKEIHNLKINKASQSSDIPTKIIKENVDIFAEFLWKAIKAQLNLPLFLHVLNRQM